LLKINEKYFIVQCKNYDAKFSVKMHDLNGFYMMMFHCNLDGKLYYNSKLSDKITMQKPTDRVEFIKKVFKYEPEKKDNTVKYTNFIENPYDYQIDSVKKLNEVFIDKNRAILQLPCGLGKTLISMMIGLNYEQIIIVSPLKQYCIQNLERFKSEIKYKDYEGLIIDSDGTRDITEIENFLEKNKKVILSICYKSCDLLAEILEKFTNNIIIIDEFHNITANDLTGVKENGLYEIFLSNSKILFMSATPRMFNIEINDDNESETFDNSIFGNIEYSYNMGDAIKTNKICNYEIYVPEIVLNYQYFLDEISKEVNIQNISNEILNKSNYIIRGMLETGSKKCILYTQTHQEAYDYMATLMDMNKYFEIDLSVDTILSDDTKNNRAAKIDKFTRFTGYCILINVQILNECIDIKECDSIFITYPSQSKIRNIQRICRANRKDPNNKQKISKVFLWMNEYDEIVDIITHLKEFDNSFMIDKIKIFSINNEDKNLILERNDNIKKYESLDNFILDIKKILTWEEKFDFLIKYIDKNKRVPSANTLDKHIHILGVFWQKQNYSYKNKIKMMKHKKYYDIWIKFKEDYEKYFSNHTIKWIEKLNEVKEFMIKFNSAPSRYSKNKYEHDLGEWIANQKTNYKNQKKMLSHVDIIEIWLEFNEEFKKYLFTNEEKWNYQFENVKAYIDENNKLPVHKAGDIDSLCVWIGTQHKNYKAKTQIMNDEEYYDKWTEFLKQYSKYFLTEEEIWFENLEKLTSFILCYQTRPNKRSEDAEEKQLGNWLVHQTQNYKKNVYNMKNENIKKEFQEFLEEFKDFI
jgi:superfamily II DNA or RNA helicase